MMFIPVTGKVNYTQAKAYCPISLKSFMQKRMQKFKTMNARDETLGNDHYIYNKLFQTREVHIHHNAPCDYTYTGSSGKQNVKLELSYILREILTALHVS
jgi:hypothetical protein